ncbi:MAG TPA: hypothetical protein VLC09_01600, partial [Polyangiaceae bacterium]|nr:hypothetical protein [Polyangiaceae bacterium]
MVAGRWAAALFLMGLVPLGGVACGGTRGDGPSDDGGPDDAGAGGGSSGETAEFDYAAVEGAVCGNGSPHGVGISAGSDESSLVLFFNGGGACWD